MYTHTTTPDDRSHQEKLGAVREDNDPLRRSTRIRSGNTIHWTGLVSPVGKVATPASASDYRSIDLVGATDRLAEICKVAWQRLERQPTIVRTLVLGG